MGKMENQKEIQNNTGSKLIRNTIKENDNFNQNKWLFSNEEITKMLRQKNGYNEEEEQQFRQSCADLIKRVGEKLELTPICINTAIVYMHRFYLFHTFHSFDWQSMSTACLLVACKNTKNSRNSNDILRTQYQCLELQMPTMQQYEDCERKLRLNENILVKTLGYELNIELPYKHIVNICELVKANDALSLASFFLASNCLHLTLMYLKYKPKLIACSCVYMASKWTLWEIPLSSEGKFWYQYIDESITLETIKDLSNEFLAIYEKTSTVLKQRWAELNESSKTSTLPSSENLTSALLNPNAIKKLNAKKKLISLQSGEENLHLANVPEDCGSYLTESKCDLRLSKSSKIEKLIECSAQPKKNRFSNYDRFFIKSDSDIHLKCGQVSQKVSLTALTMDKTNQQQNEQVKPTKKFITKATTDLIPHNHPEPSASISSCHQSATNNFKQTSKLNNVLVSDGAKQMPTDNSLKQPLSEKYKIAPSHCRIIHTQLEPIQNNENLQLSQSLPNIEQEKPGSIQFLPKSKSEQLNCIETLMQQTPPQLKQQVKPNLQTEPPQIQLEPLMAPLQSYQVIQNQAVQSNKIQYPSVRNKVHIQIQQVLKFPPIAQRPSQILSKSQQIPIIQTHQPQLQQHHIFPLKNPEPEKLEQSLQLDLNQSQKPTKEQSKNLKVLVENIPLSQNQLLQLQASKVKQQFSQKLPTPPSQIQLSQIPTVKVPLLKLHKLTESQHMLSLQKSEQQSQSLSTLTPARNCTKPTEVLTSASGNFTKVTDNLIETTPQRKARVRKQINNLSNKENFAFNEKKKEAIGKIKKDTEQEKREKKGKKETETEKENQKQRYYEKEMNKQKNKDKDEKEGINGDNGCDYVNEKNNKKANEVTRDEDKDINQIGRKVPSIKLKLINNQFNITMKETINDDINSQPVEPTKKKRKTKKI